MTNPSTRSRLLLAGLVGALLATSGCGWFRRDDAAYKRAEASNPLELPPGLDMPRADPAMTIPGTAGATASATPRTTAAGASFTVQGSVQEVWARMGAELENIEGVSVLNRAQLLGTYEVRYEDQSFLLRTQAQGESVVVSALGADGRALGDGPAAALIAALRERLR